MLKKFMIVMGFCFCLSVPAHALVVLQYHHVSDDTPKSTSTSPEVFEQHLAYLNENGFNVIGLDALANLLRDGKPLPDKTAVITFDDGYLSVYEKAYPRLKKYGFPFSVFINTQPHNSENPQFMSWRQMKMMSDNGVVFANHTVSHPHLIRRAEDESMSDWKARIWNEISTAEETISGQLKQNHKLLAYPFGEYNAELKKLLDQHGYLAFGQQSGPLSETSDKQALPRFPFGGVYGGIEDFATKVNTRPMPLTAVTAADEKGRKLVEPELPKDVERPQLRLTLQNAAVAKQVNCFASGQGKIPVKVDGTKTIAQAPKALPVGRSRYNCTAPTGEAGRFYWYSDTFIRREADRGWYEE